MSLGASLHRSQISENLDLEDYLIDSGFGSRSRPRDGGADSAAIRKENFQNRLFPFPFDFGHLQLDRGGFDSWHHPFSRTSWRGQDCFCDTDETRQCCDE